MYIGLHIKYQLMLSDFIENRIFPTDFLKGKGKDKGKTLDRP
jgi:hypothetical protein